MFDLPYPPGPDTDSECYDERHAIASVSIAAEHPDWSPRKVDRAASRVCRRAGLSCGGEVTILLTKKIVAKVWNGDSVKSYPRVYRWTVRRVNVHNLAELAEELDKVASYKKGCVVRGTPIASGRVRRLIHTCTKTGDAPTFESAPAGLRWICVDVDGVPTTHDPATDPAGYADDARQCLPPALARGRCYFQLSASAGMKPGARVHLWYWLERRAHDDALRAWANELEHVDASLFGAVQPHYVVPPQFIDQPDPIPQRTGFLPGDPEVWPADLCGVEKWQAMQEHEAQERAIRAATRSKRAQASRDTYADSPAGQARRASGAIAASVADIMSAGEGGRNSAICRRANFLGRIASTGALTIDEARNVLEEAARDALASEWKARGRTTIAAIDQCLASGFAAGDFDNG